MLTAYCLHKIPVGYCNFNQRAAPVSTAKAALKFLHYNGLHDGHPDPLAFPGFKPLRKSGSIVMVNKRIALPAALQ